MITHLSCIMDGNRRWAQQRGLPINVGHQEGIKSVERVILFCLSRGIRHLSLYTFSIENFNRDDTEKNYLFELIVRTIQSDLLDRAHRDQVQIRFVGDRTLFPASVIPAVRRLEEETAVYKRLIIHVLFAYGGQQEIVAATRMLINKAIMGTIDPNAITAKDIVRATWLGEVPFPDLVIRTGGQQRLSNFCLYQVAYSELYMMSTLWPDITDVELEQAVTHFTHIKRNYGV